MKARRLRTQGSMWDPVPGRRRSLPTRTSLGLGGPELLPRFPIRGLCGLGHLHHLKDRPLPESPWCPLQGHARLGRGCYLQPTRASTQIRQEPGLLCCPTLSPVNPAEWEPLLGPCSAPHPYIRGLVCGKSSIS